MENHLFLQCFTDNLTALIIELTAQPRNSTMNTQNFLGAKHIELWPLDKLIPYARNPRTHSDAQVAQIAAKLA